MRIPAVLLTMLLLSACSGGDESTAPPAQKNGPVSTGNAFKGEVDALARARQAEKIMQDAAEKQRREIEAGQ